MNAKIKRTRTDAVLSFSLNNKALILLIIVFCLSVFLTGGNTLTSYNLASLMRQLATYTIIAAGYTIMLSSGGMDLSVGEIISLVGVIYAMASKTSPLVIAIMAGILAGMACQFVNGFLVRFFNIPGFVTTLGMGLIYRGATYSLTSGKAVGQLTDGAKWFGQGHISGLPVPFIIAVIVVLACWTLSNMTLFGRHALAVGGNAEAAKVSGIKVDFVKVAAHVVMGVCIGIGTIVLTGRVGSAGAEAGGGFTMDCIAAVVIGGTPMSGGRAKVVGTLFGVTLITVINNMLNLLGVSPYYQWVSKGMIIVIAIILDSYGEIFFQRQRAKATALEGK